jgi:hypothetical protein
MRIGAGAVIIPALPACMVVGLIAYARAIIVD